jgi:hypothetical protein
MAAPERRVYIDLNHWIGLAKSRKGGDLALEQRLAALVDAGAIVVPVSAAHIIEIAAILSERQRQNLSSMLRSLSRGVVLRSLDEVRAIEVSSRVAAHYGIGAPVDVKSIALARGYARAFGEPKIEFSSSPRANPGEAVIAEQEVWDVLNDEKLLDEILSLYFAKIKTEGPEHGAVKAGLEQTRQAIQGKELAAIETECLSGLRRGFAALALRAVTELGLSQAQLEANPPTHFWTNEYMATLPTFNVWSKLYAYLARVMSREITVNDLYDMGHLSVAVPYCDVVVADAAMKHLLTFRRLNEAYNTAVHSDLTEAIEKLERGI